MMVHRRVLLLAAVLPAVAIFGVATPVAAAPSLSVAPQGGAPGDVVTATGAGFQPVGSVTIHVDTVAGGPVASGPVDGNGGFQLPFAIPAVPDGPHTLIACRDLAQGQCREQATAAIRVVTSAPTTTAPVIVARTTTTTTTPSVVLPTTTTTTTPVIVTPTPAPTTTGPSIALPTTSTSPPPPTIPPVVQVSTTAPGPQIAGEVPEQIDVPDIRVRGVEVTQGIQDLQSRMPLVAGRRTTVRVHVGVVGGYVAAIDGALLVERQGQPDVVLYPDNGPIPPGLDRTEIDGALNFELDADLYSAGTTTFTAQVWSAGGAWIDEEPNGANNYRSKTVVFHEGENPTVWLVALDDGGGPGPDITDLTVLLGFAPVVNQDLLDFLPISGVNFEAYWEPVLPGPEAVEPGLWNLGLSADVDPSAGARRHEPNQRMALLAELGGFIDDGLVLGLVDSSIPTDVYTGWAGYGVSWSKPEAGTPAHEAAHTLGLDHVNCLGDTDGDGIPQEQEGGSIDWSHPNGLPPVCSLAPIDPDGFFGYTNYRSPVTIYSNDPAHPKAAFPFMGYRNPGWTDPYHWCVMLNTLGVPCSTAALGLPPANPFQVIDCEPEETGGQLQLDLCVATEPAPDAPAPPPGQLVAEVTTNAMGTETLQLQHQGFLFDIPLEQESWLIASGSIDLDGGTGSIAQAATREQLSATTAARFALTIDGYELGAAGNPMFDHVAGLALRLTAADGTALAVVPVTTDAAGHGNGTEHGSIVGFFSPVPWVDGAVSIDLLLDGTLVDSRPISPGAPSVGAVQVETVGGARTISWEVDDPDGGAAGDLSFTVLWSADGGATWLPAAADVTATELTIPESAALPGGEDVQVRVIANDGVNTGEATSDSFSVPDRPPTAGIAGAPSGPIEQGELVELTALVADPEAGDLDSSSRAAGLELTWSVAGAAPQAGATLRTRDLAVGANTVELVVTDPAGHESTASVVIEVVERTSPTRAGAQPEPRAVEYFNTFQCIPDSVAQAVADSCASAADDT